MERNTFESFLFWQSCTPMPGIPPKRGGFLVGLRGNWFPFAWGPSASCHAFRFWFPWAWARHH